LSENAKLRLEFLIATAVLGAVIVLMRFDSFRFVGWESSVFIGLPVIMAMIRNLPISELGLSVRNPLKDLKYFLIASLVFLPPFTAAFFIFEHFANNAAITLCVPEGLGKAIAVHFFYFALPEEFLFRGYLQTRFYRITPKLIGPEKLGLPLAAIVCAVIFAFAHVIFDASWYRLLVFFPAVIFGWLRHRTGSILASTLFHGACNVTAFWVSGMFTYLR